MFIYDPKKLSKSIGNLDSLCRALSIEKIEIDEAIKIPHDKKYTTKTIPKKDGSIRTVYNPHYKLRKIQRKINSRIFKDKNIIIWPSYIYGSIPNQKIIKNKKESIENKDYIECASIHCEAQSILNLDIEDFFENIHESLVFKIFNDFFKYSITASKTLTSLCCYEGRVVQGALTSSYLASLCLFEQEPELVRKLHKKKLQYTRYVDDITISSKIKNYNFGYAEKITAEAITNAGLSLNKNKKQVQHNSNQPLTVHGLRVSFKTPRLPSTEISKIRASVKNLEIVANEKGYRNSAAYKKDYNKTLGRVYKLSRIGHSQYKNLLKRVKKIHPISSEKEVLRILKFLKRMENRYSIDHHKFSYWRMHNRTIYRSNLIKTKYPTQSKDIKERLKKIRSTYKK